MRQFYLIYPKLCTLGRELNEKGYALRSQLPWTHFTQEVEKWQSSYPSG
jgi:hypothetical protein